MQDTLLNLISLGSKTSAILSIYQLIIIIITTLAIAIVVHIVLNKILKIANKHTQKTSNLWDDSLLIAISKPATAIIWIFAISWVVQIILHHLDDTSLNVSIPRNLAIIISITWFAFRYINEISKAMLVTNTDSQAKIDTSTIIAITKLLKVTSIVIAATIVMQQLGLNISGILAFGGIGGIAVGFAAKDMLANFFGGFMLHLDKPFSIGDSIRLAEQNITGKVEYIGWRQSIIKTFDKRPVYLPNSIFSNNAVENITRMENRRIFTTIGLRYKDADKLKVVLTEIEQMLNKNTEIDTEKTIVVKFNQFGASSLDCLISAFTKTTSWEEFQAVRQDVLIQAFTIIKKHGADIAFPTTTLDIDKHAITAINRTT